MFQTFFFSIFQRWFVLFAVAAGFLPWFPLSFSFFRRLEQYHNVWKIIIPQFRSDTPHYLKIGLTRYRSFLGAMGLGGARAIEMLLNATGAGALDIRSVKKSKMIRCFHSRSERINKTITTNKLSEPLPSDLQKGDFLR